MYSSKHGVASNKHHRENSVDALNNSVEMNRHMHTIANAKGGKHPREQSVRISRFNGPKGNDLLHNSVHDFERVKGKAHDQLEQLSVGGHHKHSNQSQDQSYMRKSHHDIVGKNNGKDYEDGDQQAGNGGGEKLSKDV